MSRDYGEEGTFDDVEYFVVVEEMLFMKSRSKGVWKESKWGGEA